MPAGAAPNADSLRAVLRFPEYDRVPWRAFHLSARHLDQGSTLHSAPAHGCVHVSTVLDWNAECSSKSAGEDDGLHVSRNDDGCAAQHGFGPQSLLHGAEHRGTSAEVDVGERKRKSTSRGVRGSHAACHIHWSRNATN